MTSHSEELRSSPPLGMWALVCLVIGNMIGTGIYVSSRYSLSDLHEARYVLIVWLIAGVHAICGAVAYAAVANRLPISGGEYAILSRWAHPAIGFLAGWISIVAGFAAPIAICAKLLGAYLLQTLGGSANSIPNLDLWIATGALLVASTLHWVQIGWNAMANNIVVLLKLIGIAIFLALGLYYIATTPSAGTYYVEPNPEPTPVGTWTLMWRMLGSLYFTTLSYTGFNASIYLAGEYANRSSGENSAGGRSDRLATDPRVGKSMIYACVLVTFIYLGLNAVFLYTMPGEKVVAGGDSFVLDVADTIGGGGLKTLMGWIIVLSTATSVLAMTITGPQVYIQLGRDFGLSNWLSSKTWQTRVALVCQTVLALLFIWMGTMREMVTYLGLTLTACGAMAIGSIWIALAKNSLSTYPLSSVEHLCVAIYVVGATVLLIAGYWIVTPQFFICLMTFAAGIVAYGIAYMVANSNRPSR